MQCRRPGGAALGPAAADCLGDAVDIAVAAALHDDEGSGGSNGNSQTEEHRRRHRPRLRLQPHEQGEAERGVGQLRDEFEGDVDDRAGGRQRRRHPGQRQGAGAEHVAADLRQRQRLGARIAHQPRPHHLAGRGARAAARATPSP